MARPVFVLAVLCALAGCNVVGAQPAAWETNGAACLSAPAPNGAPDPATGCPTAIDTQGPDFAALDAVSRSGGPHRYVLDPIASAAEQRTRPHACCYRVDYPPPPGG